ncbi:MAG TPA: beta-ketoacyl-[acyl-carrier-protein] synthase family protein [Bacteroidia bacterium]|jgi:3-oxoacyl-[acyl-carrier-protein] synthase-1|nr:beta-ketoacyl-[acyl-carrier-protein] synthase family protein [Bacteroidia bacterium]
MSQTVFVTGAGIISAIGNNVAETHARLLACKSGIGPIKHLQTNHKDEFPSGEVDMSDEELIKLTGIDVPHYSRTSLLGMIAAREALQSAGISKISEARTGIVSSTSVAGMGATERYYKELFENTNHLYCLNTHDCGDSTECIADYLGIRDFMTTISTACSSAANAIMLGARLIKSGQLDRVVVGGTDSLSKFTLNGFNALMILDRAWCRPFDDSRSGLNLGEGAAYLVLESEAEVRRTGKKVLARLCGYGNANDAYHQTASSPDGFGATQAMLKALDVAGMKPSDIDYVNAHGTGTPNNDLSEGTALLNVFGKNMPKFSSTKAYTGHTLAPAASIEAVISILSMKHDTIFPNLNFQVPMKEFSLMPETKLLETRVNTVLSNSFGFGGNCSSLLFSKNG